MGKFTKAKAPNSFKRLGGWPAIAIASATMAVVTFMALRAAGPPDPAPPDVASPPSTPPPPASPAPEAHPASLQAIEEASTLSRSGRNEEALDTLNVAILRDSSYAQLFAKRGVTNRHLGRFDEAIADFTRAIALASTAWQTYMDRGIVYTDDLGSYELGIQDFLKVLELNPASTTAMTNIAVAYYKGGQYDQAVRQYSDVISRTTGNARTVYMRGLAHLANGDLTRARSDMIEARSAGVSVEQSLLDSLGIAP